EGVTASATGLLSRSRPLPAAPKAAITRPAAENSTTRPWPVSATQTCPAASTATPAGRSRFWPKAASTRPAAENSTTRPWPVSATQTCPAASTATPAGRSRFWPKAASTRPAAENSTTRPWPVTATPPGCASACSPKARANRGACASGSGPGEPEATGTATSMAASTLPPARAIARDRRPRHRDLVPLIDEQSSPLRPVAAKRSGRLGDCLDDQVNGPADHALLLGHPEAGPVQPGGGPEPGFPVLLPCVAQPDLGRHGGPVRGHRAGHHPVVAVAARALAGKGDLREGPGVQQAGRGDVGIPLRVARSVAARGDAGLDARGAGIGADADLPGLEPEAAVHRHQAEHGLDVGPDGGPLGVQRVGPRRGRPSWDRTGHDGFSSIPPRGPADHDRGQF